MINKSATKAGEIKFENGNSVVFWVGHNSNTGETIVWQVVWRNGKPGRSMRLTGGNITKLANEICTLPESEGKFVFRNAAAMAVIA